MATCNEDVTVNGMLQVSRPWTDWLFLRQERDVQGGGGFHIHNPWGNSDQSQGSPDRNRLEVGYRTAAGQDLFGLLVIHGPTGTSASVPPPRRPVWRSATAARKSTA